MHREIKKSKILIIDDNTTNLDLMVEILKQEEYDNIQTLSDPEKAFETINKVEPDLLILDLMMPFISGFEILKERNTFLNEKWYMPIIVITASNNPTDRKRALNLGASDFLTKPFDLNEVSLRIKNTLLTGYLLKRERQLTENLEQEVIKRTKELEEEKLIAEKNERKYRKLFDSNVDAINLFTISNGVPSNFLESNPANLKVLGYTPDQLKSKNFVDLFLNCSKESFEEKLTELSEKGTTQFEIDFNRGEEGGKILDVKCSIFEHDNEEAVLSIFRDITERKKYINTILEQIKLLKSIAWTQSHEVRAPLARILGILNLIDGELNKSLDEEIRQFLKIIKRSAEELDEMVRNITDQTYTYRDLEDLINKND